ncbi:MAG: hypothetical protein KJ697_00645, partial [Nanoarchaeota archaeon]|nr:hypothetical protein [Nanoarchaeota archaeon]
MNKKILFQFFVMFVLVLSAVAFASTYHSLTVYVYDSAENPITGNIKVYDSGGSVVCQATNVQNKICNGLAHGVYTYQVSKVGYNTFSDSVTIDASIGKYVYLTVDSTSPIVSVTGAPIGWQTLDASAGVTATDTNGIDTASYKIITYTTAPGTCPVNYNLYTLASPRTISSHLWVCGAAKDNAGNAGFSIPVEFTVDKISPVTSFSINPAAPNGLNNWYTTSPTVTLTPTDVDSGVATTYYKIDNLGSPISGISFTMAEGSHTVTYWSVDNAGNTEAVKTSVTIYVDLIDPTINTASVTCTLPGSNGWCKGTATATITSSDSPASTIRYTINGGTETAYSAPISISTDGTHSIVYWSVDNAGRQSVPQSTDVLIDKVAPATTHTLLGTLGLNGWYVSDILVTLLATDVTSGPASSQYKINSGSYTTYTVPFTLSSEGTSTFNYYSTDVAGNIEAPAITPYSAMVDKTAPTIDSLTSSTHPIQTNFYGNDPSLQWTASDTISGVDGFSFIINQNPTTDPDQTIDEQETVLTTSYIDYADGVWYFHIRAVDNAGLWGVTSHYTLGIDTDLPVTTLETNPLTPDGQNGWFVTTPIATLTAVDTGSGISNTFYTINSGTQTTYISPFQILEGDSTVGYWSVDNAGNVETQQNAQIKVDLTDPIINDAVLSGTLGPNGWYVTDVLLTLSGSDALSGLQSISYTIDSGATQTYSALFTVSGDGSYTIEYWAVDNAGRTCVHKTVIVGIDTIAPVISGCTVDPVSGSSYDSTQTYTFSCTVTDASGIDTVTFTLGGDSYTVTNVVDVYTAIVPGLAYGTYNYDFTANDASGLQTIHSDVYDVVRATPILTFNVDPVSPVTYGVTTTATCTVDNLEQTTVLTLDGIPFVDQILDANNYNTP